MEWIDEGEAETCGDFALFYQIIRTVLLTSPAPNAHQDCCFSRPPGSFKATVRYLPLMRTNEGPKWSYYKASLNRDNTSGENTLQNGERDCSGSTVLITQHNLSCFFSHMFSPSLSMSLHFLLFFLSPTCTHSHTLFPLLPLSFLRQSLWFQQAHMHGAGSAPPSISPLLLFCISIRVTNACLVPYWIRLMSLLTAFSLRQTCNEEEMRTGLLINRPTFHHESQVAGWTLC